MYKVELRRRPQESLQKIPVQERSTIITALMDLEKNPRPAGVEKVRGTDLYRIRHGNYRFVYAIDDKEQLVTIV
ncbi:MAG: type II toxin-antitoxin system RelE family toxin [Dehalococcoidales bacterium]